MTNVTGRDRLMIGKALYLTIKHQQSLPREEQAWSDIQDMKAILLASYSEVAKMMVQSDFRTGKKPADIIDEKATSLDRPQ